MNAISKIKPNATRADTRADKTNAGWLGTPVLIPGEDPMAFDQFAARIRAALKRSTAIEEIFVDDAIGHGWEVRRWRRAKGGLLLAGSHAGLARALVPIVGKHEADTLAQGWAKREPTVVAKVEVVMASADVTYDVAMAETMAAKIDVLTGFDQLMASAESRFTSALNELERYRAGPAKAVRDIVEAEFADLPGQVSCEDGSDDQ